MAYKSLAPLRVLIVDDFDNFRLTLSKIMADLGVKNISACASASEAFVLCEQNDYDLILCDYNLGPGKTGQLLLEELRFYSLLSVDTLFVMISAEADRRIVMSTYDYKPNAYLTKPITTKMLGQRLDRLLSERHEFSKVNDAMSSQQFGKAIIQLKAMIAQKSGRSIAYRKLLAKAYLMNGEYDGAELEYSTVLQTRRLDWAQVGLANVKYMRGDLSTAASWLESIVLQSPTCIEAFDLLANVYEGLDLADKKQAVLNKLVELSPMSIVRQLKLAKSAMTNYDLKTAAKTYSKVMKLGHQSCHHNRDTHINYVRSMVGLIDSDSIKDKVVLKDLEGVLNNVDNVFPAKNKQQETQHKCQNLLLSSQVSICYGKPDAAIRQLQEADILLNEKSCSDLQLQLDFVCTLMANNKIEDARKKLEALMVEYKESESYPKVDRLLYEPGLEKHRKLITQYNKKGINFYQDNDFDQSIKYFKEAAIRFPNHTGTKLNLLQAIVAKLKNQGKESSLVGQCRDIFEYLSEVISNKNKQYQRYLQLKNIFQALG